MSLFPLLSSTLSDPCGWEYPSRAFDRAFGVGQDSVDDLLSVGRLLRPLFNAVAAQSDVKNDPEKFKVMLNVSQFKPSEIDVKTVDNNIVIHGKHEEKTDEHGFIAREFTRRYMLPEGTDPEKVKSSLSANGILTIEAPKKVIQPPPSNERVVPITMEKPASVSNN